MTRQRQLIYNIINAAPEHRTAEEIYDLARAEMPSLARGTVYRNLGLLVQSGQIRKLEMPDAPARYDRERRPHPHLICQVCGQVEDLVAPEELLGPFSIMTPGVTLTGYDLKLYHVCPACQAGKAGPVARKA